MLRTKFIKGTNKKYSIREDGVVISHQSKTNPDKILKICKDKTVYLIINNKKVFRSVQILLFKHFGFKVCIKCKNKMYKKNIYTTTCSKCIQDNSKKSKLTCYYKSKETLDKGYIASTLNINVFQLTDELYKHHKKTLLLKRKICKDHNLHIQSLQ